MTAVRLILPALHWSCMSNYCNDTMSVNSRWRHKIGVLLYNWCWK